MSFLFNRISAVDDKYLGINSLSLMNNNLAHIDNRKYDLVNNNLYRPIHNPHSTVDSHRLTRTDWICRPAVCRVLWEDKSVYYGMNRVL